VETAIGPALATVMRAPRAGMGSDRGEK